METQDNIENTAVASDSTAEVQQVSSVQPSAQAQIDTEEQKNTPEGGSRAEHIKAALEVLYEHFPKAFIREGDARPLKVGILDDLKKEVPNLPGMTTSKLRAAVRMYCTRLRYFYSVREGAKRIDLQGNEVEEVTAEHGTYAKERFEQINEERKKRLEEKQEREKAQAEGKLNEDDKKPAGKKPFYNKGKKPFNKNGKFNKFKKPGFNNRPRPQYDNENEGDAETAGSSVSRSPRKPMVRVNAAAHVRRGNMMGSRSFGVKATEAELTVGTSVLVLNNNHYMKGTVTSAPEGGTVKVQLSTGLIMSLPIDRVLLPGRPVSTKRES